MPAGGAQPPQCVSFVSVLTHVPPQFVRPLRQQIPPELYEPVAQQIPPELYVPVAQQIPPELYEPLGQQIPLEQTSEAPHSRPHIPQFRTSAFRFEHPRLQHSWPMPHTTPQARQFMGSESGTHAAEPDGPQHCESAAHALQLPQCASLSPTHVPAQHRSPASQTNAGFMAPQPPQFALSVM